MARKLTAKQEKFCQGIADGLNQSDAYRAAYNTQKMTSRVLWVKASELHETGKVSVRIEELKKNIAKKNLWPKVYSINVLAQIATSKTERASDRISAVRELDILHGYNVTKAPDDDPEDTARKMRESVMEMKQATNAVDA